MIFSGLLITVQLSSHDAALLELDGLPHSLPVPVQGVELLQRADPHSGLLLTLLTVHTHTLQIGELHLYLILFCRM